MPLKKNYYAEIAVAILVIALAILAYFLVRQYQITAREGIISSEKAHFADLVQHHPLNVASVSLIEPWMTFGYVGVSFKVPPTYLMIALDIPTSTPTYPNVTIGRYAKTIATSSQALTQEVRNVVQAYLVP